MRLRFNIGSRFSSKHGVAGFTLLEIVLAMFVLGLLLTAVFAIVGGTSQLAGEMEHKHESEAQIHNLGQLCERMLRGLPYQAQVRLRIKQSGNHYLSQLAMMNAPSPLGASGAAGLTMLETEEAPDGYLRIFLSSMSGEQAVASEQGKGDESKQQRLLLMENVAKCDWRFFNFRNSEWETLWNEKLTFTAPVTSALTQATQTPAAVAPPVNPAQPGGNFSQPTDGPPIFLNNFLRPTLVELNLAIGAEPARRFLFWVPPAQSPTMPQAVQPSQSLVPDPASPQGTVNPAQAVPKITAPGTR